MASISQRSTSCSPRLRAHWPVTTAEFDGYDRKFESYNRRFDAQDRKLNEIIGVVNDHTAKLNELTEVVNRHDRKLDDLTSDIAGLREAVTHYHATVLGHGILYSELDERVRRIERHLKLGPAAG